MLRGNRQHDLIKAFAVLATGQQPAIAVTLQGADPADRRTSPPCVVM